MIHAYHLMMWQQWTDRPTSCFRELRPRDMGQNQGRQILLEPDAGWCKVQGSPGGAGALPDDEDAL